jgi:N-dimethylarginine dimethylaminohydrolase
MEQIAIETEEDYQELIKCLNSLGVEIIRPVINPPINARVAQQLTTTRPPMCPGDDLIMLGNTLITSFTASGQHSSHYDNIITHALHQGNTVYSSHLQSINGASVYQLGDQILFTVNSNTESAASVSTCIKDISKVHNVARMHQIDHIDGWFVPATPGLIISGPDPIRPDLMLLFFETYFPGWEVVTLPPTLSDSHMFEKWQKQHPGTWWVSGQEDNKQFVEFVDTYFNQWVGNVQETVFDLNMIVIDRNNVIVSHYNQQVFDALKRHNVTPHLVRLRHANFWDGGVHCVITELHREN